MGQLAIVGDDEGPLGVHVQASDGPDPLGDVEEVADRRPALRIGGRGHHSDRFVHEEMDDPDVERHAGNHQP